MKHLMDGMARRSILWLVGLAMCLLTLITLAGMSSSVVVAETVEGSARAINVAGSLRRLTHRTASLVVADALARQARSQRVGDAIAQFEQTLDHPALQRILERLPDGLYAATYRGVEAAWRVTVKPAFVAMDQMSEAPTRHTIDAMLQGVDGFVDQLDTLVAVLEHDTEGRISDLRQTLVIAILLTLALVVLALVLLQRLVHGPLRTLLAGADRIAAGDFAVQVSHTGRNELGQLGVAFNTMATELSKLYRDLENRVADKTSELQRSNAALELLYHAISRLYQAPGAPEAYEQTIRDIEQFTGLRGSMVCIEPRHDGPATVIAGSIAACPGMRAGVGQARTTDARSLAQGCEKCRAQAGPHGADAGEGTVVRLPLRDSERRYGTLHLALASGQQLDDWQRQLIEALASHMGMALAAVRRGEQARLLALQEERSVIARELHDSLAQSLSYMKIQVSLVQPLLGQSARATEAEAILADLREGISSAYRQLRELLVSFRLKLSGDFADLLQLAVDEYAAKGGLSISSRLQLGHCDLSPNQEVHVLHIVREALSNILRHAQARKAWLDLACDASGQFNVTIDDDGVGLPSLQVDRNHHGLAIMRERASSLGGEVAVCARQGGGTRVTLRFPVGDQTSHAAELLQRGVI